MHTRKTLALVLAAFAATGGSAAFADIKASDDGRDAKCAARPCPDLKSAIANPGIFDKSQLFYIVTQHNAVRAGLLPRIAINTEGSSAPDYYVEKRGAATGVYDAAGKRVGAAALRANRRTSMSWSFAVAAIGSPSSYQWRVEIVGKDGKRVDATPNRGYLKHVPG
jgi:hypothetical protein